MSIPNVFVTVLMFTWYWYNYGNDESNNCYSIDNWCACATYINLRTLMMKLFHTQWYHIKSLQSTWYWISRIRWLIINKVARVSCWFYNCNLQSMLTMILTDWCKYLCKQNGHPMHTFFLDIGTLSNHQISLHSTLQKFWRLAILNSGKKASVKDWGNVSFCWCFDHLQI